MDYYIIGSKRQRTPGHWIDCLDDMVEHSVVEVGYGWESGSFAEFYGKEEQEIVGLLKNKGEPPSSYNAHKLFLNLRPGDWVAIKKDGSPKGKQANLVIHGYARVVKKGKSVYTHFDGKSDLAHCIHVKYLEQGKPYKFPYSYSRTIHRLQNVDHIKRIFSPIFKGQGKLLPPPSPQERKRWRRAASSVNLIENQIREINKRTIKPNQEHKRIQKRLEAKLITKYGKANVTAEEDYVDLKVIHGHEIRLYEIKPYRCPILCIREAIGQVLLYAWRQLTEHKGDVTIIVVGPNKPDSTASELIDFIQRNLSIKFEYCSMEKGYSK